MAKRKAPQDDQKQIDPTSEAWRALPWRKFEQHTYRIQKRIYRARQHGKQRSVQKLEKLLMKSEAARLIAVRRVTQENQGKKTAGVDGVKSVAHKDRLIMAEQIHPKHWKHQKPKPVRRVWIPKPGKAERRPLGIPTMLERSKQAVVKMAIEPEWEAIFEKNSYGFRPGRSCQDAIAAIFNHIKSKAKFVLDADIKGCFDHIDQQALLKKLQTYPALRRTIKAWLKAGVLDKHVFATTEEGTPQGGVISPLLANIALHGMEQVAAASYQKKAGKPALIRYADDYVILHSDKEVLQIAADAVEEWLKGMGLALNQKKTRVTHTLTSYQGNVGFHFLGFTVRQIPKSEKQSGKDTHGRPLGFKTFIRPSKEKIRHHTAERGKKIKKLRGAPQEALIKELNPMIRGWANYYRTVETRKVFRRCDKTLYCQLVSWATWRHPRKGRGWIRAKYWHQRDGRQDFAVPEKNSLRSYSQTQTIRPYPKVKGEASPYDGNLLYWSKRLKTHPLTRTTLGKLLHKQQGKCRWCELNFKDGDRIEIDHLDGNHTNNALSNQVALHLHCHDERHAKCPEKWTHATGINHK
jgi:RNA-directed DNA polymerase